MVELPDLLDDIALLLLGQFRIYGERQRIASRTLCVWKMSTPVAKLSKAVLEVQRDRIIDFGFYAFFSQESMQSLPIWKPTDKLIVNMACRIFWHRNAF